MPKNRTIPFGYCMRIGEIQINPLESEAVKEIFELYLFGSSFQAIAQRMNRKGISYNGSSPVWNKNMVKRIIENEKYLGTVSYPQIINKDTFQKANEKRIRKSTSLRLLSEELKVIHKVAYCKECGQRISRSNGNSGWNCRYCSPFEYRITDQMLVGSILNILNSMIANTCLMEADGEISTYSPGTEVIRQQNEIRKMADTPQMEYDRIKAELFKLSELKYSCCTYNGELQKSKELKAFFENQEQLNHFDIGLFRSCVTRIWISHFCTIAVEFTNGSVIQNDIERTNRK